MVDLQQLIGKTDNWQRLPINRVRTLCGKNTPAISMDKMLVFPLQSSTRHLKRAWCDLRTFLMTSLRKMISVSFMVRSSSLVPDLRSLTTEGRMQRGGTNRRVRMRSAGFPDSGFIRRRGTSSFGILRKRFNTTRGLRFSWMARNEKRKYKTFSYSR